MIGSSLSEKLPGVFGTLEHPVHALNLEDTIVHIQKYYSRHPLVAIDASLGSREHLGYITVTPGSLAPGAGVNKALGDIGDISITGIIGTSGPFSHITLQTTRLSAVIPVAKQIAMESIWPATVRIVYQTACPLLRTPPFWHPAPISWQEAVFPCSQMEASAFQDLLCRRNIPPLPVRRNIYPSG